MGSVSEGNDGAAGMAKMNSVGAVGCIKKIKLLQHRIFTRGGSLKGIDLGTCGKQSNLAWALQLIDLSDFRGLLTCGTAGEFGIHTEAEISVFELGLEAGSH